jgi:chromosome segregation ATPase
MNNQTGIVVLALICVGLGAALLWTQHRVTSQKHEVAASIGSYSNRLAETYANLDELRRVNTLLEGDLKKQRDAFRSLTNAYSQVSTSLEKSEGRLRDTRDDMIRQIGQRDARIAHLESQNQALDQRILDLGGAITNLTTLMADMKMKLDAAAAEKALLEKEVQRLTAEKAEAAARKK